MLTAKETILREIENRLQTSLGIIPYRNPGVPPTTDDMPYLCLFEITDVVKKTEGQQHNRMVQQRVVTLVIEFYFVGSDENNLPYEFAEEYPKIRTALLCEDDGVTPGSLAGLCHEILELGTTKIFRPVTGAPVAGIGFTFTVMYKEALKK